MVESQKGAAGTGSWTHRVKDTTGSDFGIVIEKLRNSPLSEQLRSWIGDGANEPVTADQISAVLGDKELARIAGQTGVEQGQAAQRIADRLPGLVDEMTPRGSRPRPDDAGPSIESLMRDSSGRPLGGGAGPPM